MRRLKIRTPIDFFFNAISSYKGNDFYEKKVWRRFRVFTAPRFDLKA